VKKGNLSDNVARVFLAHIPMNKRKFMSMSVPRQNMYVKMLQVVIETSMFNCDLSKPWYKANRPPTQVFIRFKTRRRCDVNMVAWRPLLKAMFESRLLKPGQIAMVQAYEVEMKGNVTEIVVSAETSLQKAVDTGKGILLDEMKSLCSKEAT